MSFLRKKQAGFTIVELLIVIVVIAILAAISVVAFIGVQNRANDSAVQSDMNNFVKKIKLYQAEHDTFPAGNDANAPTGIGNFSLSRGSYLANDVDNNFYYCTGRCLAALLSGSELLASLEIDTIIHRFKEVYRHIAVLGARAPTYVLVCYRE